MAQEKKYWPRRLLYVKLDSPDKYEFISCKRKPGNRYYKQREPPYNILTYTHGPKELDPEKNPELPPEPETKAIQILDEERHPNGQRMEVNWKITPVSKDHFTVLEFKRVLIHAAHKDTGFVWVDIACVNKHSERTGDKTAEGYEWEMSPWIFRGAETTYIWLTSFKKAATFHYYVRQLAAFYHEHQTLSYKAIREYGRCPSRAKNLAKILDDLWFLSFWTLCEASVVRDAQFVFPDGHLQPFQPEQAYPENFLGIPWKTEVPWRYRLRFCLYSFIELCSHLKDLVHTKLQNKMRTRGIFALKSFDATELETAAAARLKKYRREGAHLELLFDRFWPAIQLEGEWHLTSRATMPHFPDLSAVYAFDVPGYDDFYTLPNVEHVDECLDPFSRLNMSTLTGRLDETSPEYAPSSFHNHFNSNTPSSNREGFGTPDSFADSIPISEEERDLDFEIYEHGRQVLHRRNQRSLSTSRSKRKTEPFDDNGASFMLDVELSTQPQRHFPFADVDGQNHPTEYSKHCPEWSTRTGPPSMNMVHQFEPDMQVHNSQETCGAPAIHSPMPEDQQYPGMEYGNQLYSNPQHSTHQHHDIHQSHQDQWYPEPSCPHRHSPSFHSITCYLAICHTVFRVRALNPTHC